MKGNSGTLKEKRLKKKVQKRKEMFKRLYCIGQFIKSQTFWKGQHVLTHGYLSDLQTRSTF